MTTSQEVSQEVSQVVYADMGPEVDVSMSAGEEPVPATEEHQQMQWCAERTEERAIRMREEAWRRTMESFAQQYQRERQRRALVEAARAIRDAARATELALLRAATEDGEPALDEVVRRLHDLCLTSAWVASESGVGGAFVDALGATIRSLHEMVTQEGEGQLHREDGTVVQVFELGEEDKQ